MTEEKKNVSAPEDKKGEKKETKEKEVKVPAKFKKLVEEVEKMSVLELSELVKVLEDKFGVAASAPVMAAPAAGADGGSAEEETKDAFNVELVTVGDSKIAVIKAVNEITGSGLKEAKDLVDGAPKVVKENVPTKEAEEMKKKLEEAGATIELK